VFECASVRVCECVSLWVCQLSISQHVFFHADMCMCMYEYAIQCAVASVCVLDVPGSTMLKDECQGRWVRQDACVLRQDAVHTNLVEQREEFNERLWRCSLQNCAI
jgi:hypothetical protein